MICTLAQNTPFDLLIVRLRFPMCRLYVAVAADRRSHIMKIAVGVQRQFERVLLIEILLSSLKLCLALSPGSPQFLIARLTGLNFILTTRSTIVESQYGGHHQ